MAVNKAERQALEQAQMDLTTALALRWSGHKQPDMLPPPIDHGVSCGWLMNVYRCEAFQAWSRSYSHGEGRFPAPSQMGVKEPTNLYTSRRDALIGLRLAKEREFALQLAKLDAEIEAAE